MNGGDQQQAVPLQQQYYQPYMYAQQDGQQAQGYPVFQLPPQQYAPVEQQAAQQQGFYPQIPVQQPQYIFTETNTTEAEPCQRHCNKRFNAYKIGTAITIASFVAYFIVTPSAFPWFLIIASISAGAMASKFIRDHYADNQPRFRKHAAWFGCINIAFLLVNLWSGGFPFSVVPIAVWGTVLAMHAESIYNRDPLKKGLLRHAIIYAAVGLIILVAVGYLPSLENQSRFNRMRRPDMKKPKDGKMEAEFTGFRKHGRPSDRPTAVPGVMSTRSPGSQETSRPVRPSDRPTPVKPQESGRPQKPEEGRHKGGHHGKGNRGTKQPEGTKKPVDEEEREHEIRKEYARETARNDTHYRFIMRTVGFVFMLVWSVVLLIHACKAKRAIKRRNHLARNAQPVELQSVDVAQQPNVVLQTGSIQN